MKNYWIKRNTEKTCNRKWSKIEIHSRLDSWLFDDDIDAGEWIIPSWNEKPFDFGNVNDYFKDPQMISTLC